MLQDAIWANTDKLSDPTYQDTTVKFLTASYQGWIYCATHAAECRDIVVKAGSKLGASHQLWQMNEVNKLIWPSPQGIGMVDKTAWDRTVTIASQTEERRRQDGAQGHARPAWLTPTSTPRRRWPTSRRWAWTPRAPTSSRSPSRCSPAAAEPLPR